MSRGLKWASGIFAVLLLVGAFVFANRAPIALGLISLLMERRLPIGPNQDVAWASGDDPFGRAPGERPPNVVLILADDLGWNDFTSNNGGAGYIGLPEVNRPFRGWKITLFEGGIRVPFFAKWPGRIPPGTVVEAPVHHFDVYATVAAAAGAPLPDDRVIDGVDLVPFALREAPGVPHEALFWRSGASQTALVNGWKLNVSDPPAGGGSSTCARTPPSSATSLASVRRSWPSFAPHSPPTTPSRPSRPSRPGRAS